MNQGMPSSGQCRIHLRLYYHVMLDRYEYGVDTYQSNLGRRNRIINIVRTGIPVLYREILVRLNKNC